MSFIVGIDPGSQGVIASVDGDVVLFDKLPYKNNKLDVEALEDFFQTLDIESVIIELPFIMKGNKNKGLTSQLKNYGALWAVCTLCVPNVIEVMPRTWKKVLKLSNDKEASIKKAKQIKPDINLKLSSRCTVDNHNAAEAFLLAYWGGLT